MKRKIRIGFDLDGVLVDKPPLMPKRLLEWLVRSHSSRTLNYRFPQAKWEQLLRWLSHVPFLRPPIKTNAAFVKDLFQSGGYEFYLISGRYSFLEGRTKAWLERRGMDELFKKVSINLKNEQPHLFKEKTLRQLKIDVFIDDDPLLAAHLTRRLPKKKIFCLDYGLADKAKVNLITSLSQIF